MKRLLSTLTALCMCASMSVGMLPASALSAISTDDTAVVRADSGLMARVSEDAAHNNGYEWSIGDVTFDPENPPKNNIIQMQVNVWNDPGTSGCTVKLTVDGKEFSGKTAEDFPFEIALMKKGTAYAQFTQFTNNPDSAEFADATANSDGSADVAAQGGAAATIAFKLKDGAKLTPGTKYEIGFDEEACGFSDSNKQALNPTLNSGYIIIAGGEDTTTAPTQNETKAPTEPDTKAPTETKTPATSENNHDNGYEWAVEDATFDPANPPKNNIVQMNVNVWNDPGTSGCTIMLTVDGKKFSGKTAEDFPFEVALMKKGTAYASFTQFTNNPDTAEFADATASSDGSADVAAQGGAAAIVAFKLKDGAELTPGTKYEIGFAEDMCGFSNADKQALNPILTPGYLIIAGGDDPVEPPVSEGYKWYVQDAEFDPSTEEQVSASIKVAGDPGTFAYYFSITIDGKSPADADFPFELKGVLEGKAYSQLSAFTGNPASGKAAGTTENPASEKNGIAKDDGIAVNYVLAPKEGVTYTPGTKYKVEIVNSKFTTFDKQVLFPDLEAGFITIKGENTTDEPTSEPATDAPTDPKPTDADFEHKEKEVDAKWIIGHDTVEPGAEVTIPVYVEGNTDGFNSYIADIKAAEGPVLKDGSNGKISENLNFVENPDKLIFSATNFTKGGEMVKGDGDVFYMTFTAPTKPGKYALDFENLEIYDIDMVQLIPKTENGWIEVKAEETDFEHKKQDTAAKWVIGKVEIDAGTTTARVPVSVQGASEEADGINSYIAKIKQDKGPKATGAEAGKAYAELGLQQNLNDLDLIFAGTNSDQKKNITAADGDVFYIDFEVPADAAPGTVYNLKFADLELENMDMVQLIPTTEDGWIKIKEAETTTTEPIEVGDAGMWVIGTKVAAPGEKVTIPVTVTGDKNGINSFIMKMGNPGIGEVAPVPEGAEKGNAYGEKISFVPNIEGMTFGSTNFELGENLMLTKDGAVVFNVTFTAPTEPGQYDLTFEDLSVYDINMSVLTPETQDGWIKVVAETTTVSETAEPDVTTTTASETAKPVATTTTAKATEPPVETTTTAKATEPPASATTTTAKATEPPASATTTTAKATEPPVSATTTTAKATEPPVSATTTTEQVTEPPVQTTTTEPATEPPVQTTTTEPATEPPVQTTTTEDVIEPPVETTTTSDIVKGEHEYKVTWEIGKDIGYAGEPIEIPIIVKGEVDEAMAYNVFKFELEIDDGPVLKPESIRAGSAYSEMTIEANGFQVAGVNPSGDSAGYNGATILYLTFDLPDDLAAGKYNVKFAGDVEAHNRAYDKFEVTEEDGYIQVIPKDVTIEQKEFQFDVEGLSKFYFSHDHREFINDGLLQSELISLGSLMARPVLSDPSIEVEWVPADLDKIEFKIKDADLVSPKAVFDTKVAPTLTGQDDTVGKAFFKEQLAFTISTEFETYNLETGEIETREQKDVDTLFDGRPMVTGSIYIGVKGDTNLDGTANAKDAALQLIYAADNGSGGNPDILTVESDMISAIQAEGEESAKELENFVYFLSDVTDESEDHGKTSTIPENIIGSVDAKDAAKVLIYAADAGSGKKPDWYRVLDEPLPKYTKLIGAADGNNDKN